MVVRFTDNLGSRDAASYGLDFKLCTKGAEVEVADGTGSSLVAKRLAVEVSRPQEIKAVPAPPAISESKPATVRGKQTEKQSQ